MRNLAVVLPITDPSEKHYHFVRQLSGEVRQIVVVDDGSEEENFSKQMNAFSNVTVLHHPISRGMGTAFRTAMTYLINHGRSIDGVVLVRDTEKLSAKSACKMADQFIATKDNIVIGEVADDEGPSSLEKVLLKQVDATIDVEYQTLQIPMIACDRALFGYLSHLPGTDDEYLFNLLLLVGVLQAGFTELPLSTSGFDWEASKATLVSAARDVQEDPSVLLVP